nr:unnamed protein product [Callosobruchus analis]
MNPERDIGNDILTEGRFVRQQLINQLSAFVDNSFLSVKSKIKKRAREQRQHISQTGGGGYICSELRTIDRKSGDYAKFRNTITTNYKCEKNSFKKEVGEASKSTNTVARAAELYASSTSEMATAVGDMAVAITNWLKAYHNSP